MESDPQDDRFSRIERNLLIMAGLFAIAIGAVIYLYIALVGEPGRVKAAVDREIQHRTRVRNVQFCHLLSALPHTRLTDVVRRELACDAALKAQPRPGATSQPSAPPVAAPQPSGGPVAPRVVITRTPRPAPRPTVTHTRTAKPTPPTHKPSPTPEPTKSCLLGITTTLTCQKSNQTGP